jgi:hypothetical protein
VSTVRERDFSRNLGEEEGTGGVSSEPERMGEGENRRGVLGAIWRVLSKSYYS